MRIKATHNAAYIVGKFSTQIQVNGEPARRVVASTVHILHRWLSAFLRRMCYNEDTVRRPALGSTAGYSIWQERADEALVGRLLLPTRCSFPSPTLFRSLRFLVHPIVFTPFYSRHSALCESIYTV